MLTAAPAYFFQEKFFVNPLDDLKQHSIVIARLTEINRQKVAEALKRQQELEAAENSDLGDDRDQDAGEHQLNDTAQDSSNIMEGHPGGMGEDEFGDQQMDDMEGFV